MIAIIAEKPSVGQDIARVLGVKTKRDGYLEGQGYMITWAYGHLVSLALPEDYGINSYERANLPIQPEPFQLIPRKTKTKKGYEPDKSALKQLNTIKKVFTKCDSIIVATDAGREGELIFRFIYQYIKCKKPFSRLWISSLTDTAIKQGFDNLKAGSEYDNLYLAAEARSKADWLLGINASRAICLSTGDYNNSLGRVQTPTLALICKRYLDNTQFKPEPYWQLAMNVSYENQTFTVRGTENYFEKKEVDNIFKHLKTYPLAKVSKMEKKEVSQQPPLLHDLTSLQKDANNRFGFGADKTLKLAQSLYEKKLISYPRTGSKYIPDDVFENIPDLLKQLKGHPRLGVYAAHLAERELCSLSVDKKKITDHHALLITDQNPQSLAGDEKIIYEMIAVRMLEAFSSPHIKDVTIFEICCDDITFQTKGSIIKQQGWKDILNQVEDEIDDNQQLPNVQAEDFLTIDSHNMVEKKTKPKPLYTEASLLAAMETAGKEIEDKDVRKMIKDCGIGTPATRASIIQTLFNRDYMALQNKSLVPTKKGLMLYEQIKAMRIADVEMTGLWEQALLKIEKSPKYYDSFLNGLKVHVKQVTDEIFNVIAASHDLQTTSYVCPKCKLGKVSIYPTLAKCNYTKCRFTLYRTILGQTLSDEEVAELIKREKSPLIKGFIGKSGKTFDAFIVLENGRPKFVFPTKEEIRENK